MLSFVSSTVIISGPGPRQVVMVTENPHPSCFFPHKLFKTMKCRDTRNSLISQLNFFQNCVLKSRFTSCQGWVLSFVGSSCQKSLCSEAMFDLALQLWETLTFVAWVPRFWMYLCFLNGKEVYTILISSLWHSIYSIPMPTSPRSIQIFRQKKWKHNLHSFLIR